MGEFVARGVHGLVWAMLSNIKAQPHLLTIGLGQTLAQTRAISAWPEPAHLDKS